MLTQREEKFLAKWRTVRGKGRFKYFLRNARIGAAGGFCFASILLLLTHGQINADYDTNDVIHTIQGFIGKPATFILICMAIFGTCLPLIISGRAWRANEFRYLKLREKHHENN